MYRVALLLAAGLLSACNPLEADLGLKVSKAGPGLTIQNVGTGPIEIKDITVNDRPDCTTIRLHTHALPRAAAEFKTAYGDGHTAWFVEQAVVVLLPWASRDKKILQVGDKKTWDQACDVVRATVKTDRGTETFHW